MDNKSELQKSAEEIYFLLRDEGFSEQSEAIMKLVSALEKNDVQAFQKAMKSSAIWGGAGSVIDIDFRDGAKNKLLQDNLKILKGAK